MWMYASNNLNTYFVQQFMTLHSSGHVLATQGVVLTCCSRANWQGNKMCAFSAVCLLIWFCRHLVEKFPSNVMAPVKRWLKTQTVLQARAFGETESEKHASRSQGQVLGFCFYCTPFFPLPPPLSFLVAPMTQSFAVLSVRCHKQSVSAPPLTLQR